MPSGLANNNSAISNPKLHADKSTSANARLFPYYAGYSAHFVKEALQTVSLPQNAVVLDPWNGSGTTTRVARELGHEAIGFDLNPVMVLAAKAALLSPLEIPSLRPLADSILNLALSDPTGHCDKLDPLLTWLQPASAARIRAVEEATNKILISSGAYLHLRSGVALSSTAPIAAFFYVVIFRSIRKILERFIPTNPTWVKKPNKTEEKVRILSAELRELFLGQLNQSINDHRIAAIPEQLRDPRIGIGNSESLPLPDASIDVVVTSPPYCTRIDYAVATAPELAVLRFDSTEFDSLRRALTGTSTVTPQLQPASLEWGSTCLNFLSQVQEHPSKASESYYLKNHAQYFHSLSKSLMEISRVLRPGAQCIVVAQDSHYKEIHNDIPKIISEMGNFASMKLARRIDFESNRSMVLRNSKARKYLEKRKVIESVLWLQRI